MIEKNNHVALNIGGISPSQTQTRKSCRRIWNQLPRCQRNLILLVIVAICVTLITIFIPGDPVVTDNIKEQNHINIAPFKDDHANINAAGNFLQNNNNPEFLQHERPQQQQQEQSLNNDKDIKKIPILLNEINKKITELKPLDIKNKRNEKDLLNPPEVAQLSNNDLEIEKLPEQKNSQIVNDPSIDEILNKLDENSVDSAKDFKGPSNERQHAVVEAFKHSWKGYKDYAWGHDNLKPVSMSSHDWFGLGLTIVDSLDTLYIMDLQEEYDEARNWVDRYLLFDIKRDVNLFEVTIRILGGLLGAYHLSGDKMFLKKSIELGNRLLPCFDSPSGIPYSDINLGTMTAHSPKWSPDSSTSEVTTLQLEFRDLSRSTGNNIYEQVIHRVNEIVHALEKPNGLVPIFINANTGTFRNFATISLGARGDSYYEYLLKQWIQTGRKDNDFLIQDYTQAINGVISQLVRKTPKEQHTYIGELINGKDFKPKMDHLTCYLPGTLLLGHKFGMPDTHLQLARDLLETCYQTYMKQPTHLAPEITYFSLNDIDGETDIQVKSNDAHNLLRPEFIESLYYFYSLTGNHTYQDMGWNIFQAFEKYTKVKFGYTSIGNVKNIFNTRPRDMMESFWLGETLKYFYLLFSDDRNEIDLEKFIFNSEAHPLPVRKN